MWNTDTKQVSPFPDHEAALLQVHQLQLDIEASQSQAVEKEETARKEIDELKLQVQECLLAREHEKTVSAVANPFCQTSQKKRCAGDPQFCPAWTTKKKSGFLPGECSWAENVMISLHCLFLQVLELEESTRALNNEHFPSPENSVVQQNGEVAAADVIQLQKDNRELEQQIAEKNKVNRNS